MSRQTISKVLVVDDHPLMAEATKQIFEQIEFVEVVGVAGDGGTCMEMMEQLRPDIVFLDYLLPDQSGKEVAESIKRLYPDTHIVIFTGKDIADLFDSMIGLPISGILSKEADRTALVQMVQSLREGNTVVPLALFHRMRVGQAEFRADPILTPDEHAILRMVLRGMTHEQIAEQIYTSKRSVDNYLKRIYEKFGVTSKAQAIERFVNSKYYTGTTWD